MKVYVAGIVVQLAFAAWFTYMFFDMRAEAAKVTIEMERLKASCDANARMASVR